MPRSRRRTVATPIPASVHNAVMEKAQRRVDKLEGRLARVIQPLLEQAGDQAAERFTRLATNHLAAAAANSDVSATATMICVRPRPDEAAAIADPDGDPPELLHVTLVYLGQVEDDQVLADAVEALRPVAAQFAPLEGVVGGYGLFDPAGVGVLLPDVRGLVELRVAVCEALLDAGIEYGRDHGFEAHITVHRDPTDVAQKDALERAAGAPLHFDSLYVVRGNSEEVEVPLVGVPALTADAGNPPPPSWTAPFPDELMNVSSFVNLILEKTNPVRKAMIEQTMTPALRAAGLAFDVTNPLTNAAFASTASQVTSIAQTTQLNLMQIIRSSYRNGLSIPQTSNLIREGMKSASKVRATMIARTELARAVNGGSLAATQLVSSATGSQYDKRWETAPGAKYPRHEDYPDLNGQTVGLNDAFAVGGDELQYPGDPDGSPEETINCFPGATIVVASHPSVGFRRRYVGSLVRIETDRGDILAGTPNHPVLTRSGWQPLHLLREGDHVVCGLLREGTLAVDPDVEHTPAAIQEVVAALARLSVSHRVRGRAVQFHGDPSADGEVEVVAPHGELGRNGYSPLLDPPAEGRFVRTDEVAGLLAPTGSSCQVGLAAGTASDRVMGGGREPLPFLRGSLAHPFEHRSGAVARLDPQFEKPSSDHAPVDAVALGQRLLGDAFEVSTAQIVKVEVQAFHGDVFNLQTESGVYLASNIMAHNCRCAITYHTPEGGEETADAETPPTLDTADAAGGGGGGGQITLPTDALTAHLTPLNGTSANGLAVSLETRAKMIEPALTDVMKASADANGADLAGLDYRLKSEESATRKIESDAIDRHETVRETAYGVSDMVRYTALYEPDQYVAGTQAMLKDIQSRGLRVVRFRNTWEPHSPYAGVNIQMAAANGYRFELQFHTPDSFALKNGIQHKLYEQWRVLPTGDPLRAELTQQMAANTDALTFPPGVNDLTYDLPGTSAELGVTPFRPEDDPIGFYNSAKYQQFVDQVGSTANDYGVTVEGFDHMTGVWQGETEPSVAIRAHDHELGLQAFASSLGKSYEQDGVLVFGKGDGDVLATFPKSSSEDAFKAMKAAGFDAGRITTGGQLQVIGPDTTEFRERLVRVWDDLGEPQMGAGSFSLIENSDYQKAIDAYAAPPPTAAELAAMPRTVEDIVPGAPAEVLATVREDIERRVSTYAQKHHMTHDEYLDAALASIREGVADPTVRIRVSPDDLASIAEDGRFKSQFETGTSGGMLDNDFRARAEKNMFGYPADLPPEERPIYAYLAGSASETGAITGYGHIIVNLKDEANFRTTFSTSDSLGYGGAGGLSPSPLLEPSLDSWTIGTDPVDAEGRLADLRNGSYVEAQVHGGVTTDDIAEVLFSRTEERNKIDGFDAVVSIRENELAGMEQRLQELLDSPESVPADIYPGAVEKAKERVADAQAQLDHWKKVAEDAAMEGPNLRTRLDELGVMWKMLENFEGLVGPAS